MADTFDITAGAATSPVAGTDRIASARGAVAQAITVADLIGLYTTAYTRSILDDGDAATARTTLGISTVGNTGSAADLTGTLADGRLSANVPLLNGTSAFTALQTFSAGVTSAFGRWTEIDLSASPITGTSDNYTLGGQVGTLFRIAGSGGSAQITGLSIGQSAGRVVTLYNAGSEAILLGGSGSTFANRFDFGTSDALHQLNPAQSVTVIYDGTPLSSSRRWRPTHPLAYSRLEVNRPSSGSTEPLASFRTEAGVTMLAVTSAGDVTDENALSRITPAYTGADASKVLAVSADGLSVEWTGITIGLEPSGGDDTAAVQAALDALATAGGGTLQLGAGTFSVTTTLDITGTGAVMVTGAGGTATVIANSHNTAPTLRVLGEGSAGVGGWNVKSVIRDVCFNPSASARDDDAPEIDVQYAVGTSIVNVAFGHPSHDYTLSKVGTFLRVGDRANGYTPGVSPTPPWSSVLVYGVVGTGCHRVFDVSHGVDFMLCNSTASSLRTTGEGIRVGAGTEGIVLVNADIIGAGANPSGTGLLIEDGARFGFVANVMLDSWLKSVSIAGDGFLFTNCWFVPTVSASSRPIEFTAAAASVRVNNCICLYGTVTIAGHDCNLTDSIIGHSEAAAVSVASTARDFYLRNLSLDNDAFPPRVAAGTLSSDLTVALTINGSASGQWRDVRHRKGSFTQAIADSSQPSPAAVRDTFTAANGTALNGRTPSPNTPGNNWATLDGTSANQTIQGNKASLAMNGAREDVVIDAGTADGFVSTDLAFDSASTCTAILLFRVSDASNYWQLTFAASGLILYKIVAGAVGQSWPSAFNPVVGTTYTPVVTLSGNSISVRVGPYFIQDVVDSFNATQTKHGIGGFCVGAGTATFDNFCVTGG